jgi:hypothetical protein
MPEPLRCFDEVPDEGDRIGVGQVNRLRGVFDHTIGLDASTLEETGPVRRKLLRWTEVALATSMTNGAFAR